MEIGNLLDTALYPLSSAQTSQDAGILMLSKQLDTTRDMGASMIQAMELSVNPSIGGNFNAYA